MAIHKDGYTLSRKFNPLLFRGLQDVLFDLEGNISYRRVTRQEELKKVTYFVIRNQVNCQPPITISLFCVGARLQQENCSVTMSL